MVINYNQLLLLWMIIIQFGDNYGNYQLLFLYINLITASPGFMSL